MKKKSGGSRAFHPMTDPSPSEGVPGTSKALSTQRPESAINQKHRVDRQQIDGIWPGMFLGDTTMKKKDLGWYARASCLSPDERTFTKSSSPDHPALIN